VLFARSISPVQNWWRNLLGRDISCSQWEGPSMHSRCLAFFPFRFFLWGGGWRVGKGIFFMFPWFPICSQYVLNGFPSDFQYVPQHVFHKHLTFIPHTLANVVRLSPITYIAGPKGRTSILQNRTWSDWEFIVCQNGIMKIKQTRVELAKVLWWLKKLLKNL